MEALEDTPGVESVHAREQAAEEFELMPERIGDILVLGDADTVFGSFESAEVAVQVRSHGSRHEAAVPIIAFPGKKGVDYRKNFDLVAQLGIAWPGG